MISRRPTVPEVVVILSVLLVCYSLVKQNRRPQNLGSGPTRFTTIRDIGLATFRWSAERAGEVVFQEAPISLEEPVRSWSTELLPFFNQDELYERIDHTEPWDSPVNREWFQCEVVAYQNPLLLSSRPSGVSGGYAVTHYAANSHVAESETMASLNEISRADGVSQTLWIGEAAGHFKPWGQPGNWRDPTDGLNESLDGFGAPDEGVAFVFGDGHVEVLSADIDPSVLHALSTPDGGETLSRDDF